MNKLLLSIVLALSIFVGNFARAEAPKPGETAPLLKLTGMLQASGKLEQNLKSLQGKVVVLEFWATWCAPCIEAMPHLNDLSEKYKNKGVQFISITRESVAQVNGFLKNRKINGWVGIDGDKAMYEAYRIHYIPFTVVIGPNGKVLGYPKSADLSEEMLVNALLGKEIVQKVAIGDSTVFKATVAKAEPLYELSIRPSASEITSSKTSYTDFEAKGTLALDLIKVGSDAMLKHVEVTAELPKGKFDVIATNFEYNSPPFEWRGQLLRMLQEVWGIDVHQEQKEMEVYELFATATANKRLVKAKPEKTDSEQSTGAGVLTGRNISIPVLAKLLQDSVSIPVVDVTNLKGNYDYNLYFDSGKPETLVAALEKSMGLSLRKVKRPVDVLIISTKKKKLE
jgi:uncharacterized protein (TIGR03435 family)